MWSCLNFKCWLLSLKTLGWKRIGPSLSSKLKDIVNSCLKLGKRILGSKVVRKILRSLYERSRLKVIAIEESKNMDMMRVGEFVASL